VAKVAALSYGNESAANSEKLFQRIVDLGHLSCLEFVPDFPELFDGDHLPKQSVRSNMGALEVCDPQTAAEGSANFPATSFLVECPLYVRSQWMRHRSFSYLEMSRRYTKGSKVAWEYYGPKSNIQVRYAYPEGDEEFEANPESVEFDAFHMACETEYQRRLSLGMPNEIARGCMPMEAMTKFWVAGFNRDWDSFIRLRDDAHAQPEIRVFAQWIRNHLHPNTTLDAGNLGT